MSEYIGLVLCENELRQVISPDYDEQLNDPAWTTSSTEKLVMIKIPRTELPYSGHPITISLTNYINKNIVELVRRFA